MSSTLQFDHAADFLSEVRHVYNEQVNAMQVVRVSSPLRVPVAGQSDVGAFRVVVTLTMERPYGGVAVAHVAFPRRDEIFYSWRTDAGSQDEHTLKAEGQAAAFRGWIKKELTEVATVRPGILYAPVGAADRIFVDPPAAFRRMVGGET